MQKYAPTADDIANVVRLLHDNGINVSNSKAAYEQLKQYEANPFFCMLLASVFAATECPLPDPTLAAGWPQYRQLAGLTLKNNLSASRHALGEEAILEAARCSLTTLSNATNPRMARVSAQIVVKITSLTSFDWWQQAGVKDIASFLLNDMLQSGGLKTLGALYALQYIMEDLPRQVGAASENIINQVASISQDKNASLDIRKAAFRMCFSTYEQASLLDWNIDNLSTLQLGLVKASFPFSCVCSTLLESQCEGDASFVLEVLRSCWFLLDYFDHFPPEALTPVVQQRYQNSWIGFAYQTVINATNFQPEVVSAAIDLISGVLDAYEASGGECTSSFLTSPLVPLVPKLLEALVSCSYLSEEEITDILSTDLYTYRDTTGVMQSMEKKDIAEDTLLDDNVAAMSLRSSAIKCIESISQFETGATFSVLIKKIEELWSNTDWKVREVAFVLLGTMAESCSSQMENRIGDIVQQVIGVVQNAEESTCVISMAIWSLTRLLDSVYATRIDCFGHVVNAFSSRMENLSKRIQHAAVSGLNHSIEVLEKFNTPGNVCCAMLIQLTQVICNCLSVYHTNNLSLLIDLIGKVLPYLKGTQDFDVLSSAVKKERAVRAAAFESSYTNLYVQKSTNEMLNKDLFSLDRGVIILLRFHPDTSFAADSLRTWSSVLEDILQREVTDDADLVFNTLLTCAGYIQCISTPECPAWISDICARISSAAFRLWTTSEHRPVAVASVTLLGAITQSFGASCINANVVDSIYSKLAEDLPNEEEPQFKNHLVTLGAHLVQQNPNHALSLATYETINRVLRSDVFGDSLLFFIEMSATVCKTLALHPQLLMPYTNINVILELLAQSSNHLLKSDATIHLCSVMPALAVQQLSALLPLFMRMLYSWQQAACHYPGTVESLKAVLELFTQQCGNALHQTLISLPPTLGLMIKEVYAL